MNLCKDCANVRKTHLSTTYSTKAIYWRCAATERTSPVDGAAMQDYCSDTRLEIGACGPDGKLWRAAGRCPQKGE